MIMYFIQVDQDSIVKNLSVVKSTTNQTWIIYVCSTTNQTWILVFIFLKKDSLVWVM